MHKDKQLVRITVFVLLVGIVLVYAVFFNIQGKDLYAQASRVLQLAATEKSEDRGDDEQKERSDNELATVTGLVDTEDDETPRDDATGNTVVFSGLSELFGDDVGYLDGEIRMLSGTTLFDGSIDVLRTLGINYEYILKDNEYNIYYVYIGRDKTYNLREIAREFGWKTIEVYAEKDIINNLYFGDRVTFVELPQYENVKVNVFIQMGNDLRMIQDDASQYRAHKRHIRKLFTGK